MTQHTIEQTRALALQIHLNALRRAIAAPTAPTQETPRVSTRDYDARFQTVRRYRIEA